MTTNFISATQSERFCTQSYFENFSFNRKIFLHDVETIQGKRSELTWYLLLCCQILLIYRRCDYTMGSLHACAVTSIMFDSLKPHELYSPPGSSVHGILQVRILEWITKPSSRGSSDPGTEATCLMSPELAGRFFTTSSTWEAHAMPHYLVTIHIWDIFLSLFCLISQIQIITLAYGYLISGPKLNIWRYLDILMHSVIITLIINSQGHLKLEHLAHNQSLVGNDILISGLKSGSLTSHSWMGYQLCYQEQIRIKKIHVMLNFVSV